MKFNREKLAAISFYNEEGQIVTLSIGDTVTFPGFKGPEKGKIVGIAWRDQDQPVFSLGNGDDVFLDTIIEKI